MNDKILVKRNGTEFYRIKKVKKYDKMVSFKYSEDKIERLKQKAEKEGTKYQTLIKKIIDNYLESEVN